MTGAYPYSYIVDSDHLTDDQQTQMANLLVHLFIQLLLNMLDLPSRHEPIANRSVSMAYVELLAFYYSSMQIECPVYH